MEAKKKYDISYDHLLAIQLAQKLTRGKHRQVPAPADPPMAASQEPATLTLPVLNFTDRDIYRDQTWRVLLDWSLEELESEWAFLSDERGLVIADSGQNETHLIEEAASQLAHALINLQRASAFDPTQAVLLKKGRFWHVGLLLQLNQELGAGVILGLVSECRPSLQRITQVYDLLTHHLADQI